MKRPSVIMLTTAIVALIASVLSWLAAGSTEQLPPVLEGEPSITTVVYYPPLIVLALALAAASGVLAVLGIARLRAGRR